MTPAVIVIAIVFKVFMATLQTIVCIRGPEDVIGNDVRGVTKFTGRAILQIISEHFRSVSVSDLALLTVSGRSS